MADKKFFSSLNRVIAGLITLLLVIVIGVLLYEYGGGLTVLVSGTAKKTNAFGAYDVTKTSVGDTYMINFKDLITSAGGPRKSYYRYDLTMETKDSKTADQMIRIRKQVISIINGVMSTFPTDDMNTEAERNRVKQLIKAKVTEHYPDMSISDIYFTNFLYN